jgi:hypothetical protein
MTALRDLMIENHINHTFWCFNENSGDTGGLVYDNFGTWDEEKYEFVKPALWQDDNGKFISLDHTIALGANGISLSDYYANSSETTEVTTTGTSSIISGDVNEDKKVNVIDLALLKNKLLDDSDIPAILQASPYDTDGNGTFNISDAVNLSKYLLKAGGKLCVYEE